MITTDEIREAVAKHGGMSAAARYFTETGRSISRYAIRRRLAKTKTTPVELPFTVQSAEPSLDIAALIKERTEKYERARQNNEKTRIVRVKVNTQGPIGIGWMGDPHVDDDGTDLGLVFRHAELFDGRVEGLFGACIGDVWNNWVGRLARLWADQSTSAVEARALMTEYVNLVDWLIFLKGNHDCVTPDVECLTRRGWKLHQELLDDDQVLSLNPETEQAEWVDIQAKIVRPHKGIVYDMVGRGYDITMTPNHRVFYQTRSGQFLFKTAEDCSGAWNLPLPASGGGPTEDCPLTDEQIRIAAWLMTDSHYHQQGTIAFYQSGDASRIVELLEALSLPHRVVSRDRAPQEISGRVLKSHKLSYEVHVGVEPSRTLFELVPDREELPSWVFELSDRQFDIFAQELIFCDGHLYPRGCHPTAALHKKKSVLDQWQAAFITHGWKANITENGRGHFVLNVIRKRTVAAVGTSSITSRGYDGLVWCLTVEHGNFLVRRNGQAHFTGNCWSGHNDIMDFLLNNSAAVARPTRAQVVLEFPNGREVKIYASHDFKGRSQWSPSHGPAKKAQTHQWADIYIAGHIHDAAYQHGFHADGRMWHAVRMASYKKLDEYVEQLDLEPSPGYECPVCIIDPEATSDVNLVRWEWDPFEAAKRLKWMRDDWRRGAKRVLRAR